MKFRTLTFLLLSLVLSACDSDPSRQDDAQAAIDLVADQDASNDTPSDTADDSQNDTIDDAITAPPSSHGAGGLTCSSQGTAAVDGVSYRYCLTTVEGVELKIIEPTISEGPQQLALYFHGDGAGPYQSDFALKKHAPFTSTHNILHVAALAPNRCTWWLEPEYTVCDANTPIPDDAIDREGRNAVAVAAVIEALRAGWDLLDEPVLLGGSSGGSIFLTASFLPKYGDSVRGLYALSCGGAKPWTGSLDWEVTSAQLDSTKLSFTYGDKDFVEPEVEQGLAFYQGLGFATDVRVVPETVAEGSSHCGNIGGSYSYDQLGRIPEMWAEQLGN